MHCNLISYVCASSILAFAQVKIFDTIALPAKAGVFTYRKKHVKRPTRSLPALQAVFL